MAFQKYTWKNRQLQTSSNKGKRTITNVDTSQSQVVKFSRDEGKVYTQETEFNAENMNDLESRIKEAFDAIENIFSPSIILNRFYPVGSVYTSFSNTSPATLFGGTWQNITGGLLIADTGMPENMIQSGLQYTDNNNNQTLQITGNLSTSVSIQTGNAELPAHTHNYSDKVAKLVLKSVSCNEGYVVSGGKLYSGAGVRANGLVTGESGDSGGHSHGVSIGTPSVAMGSISVNIEKPALTVYMWVRTA